MIVSLLVWSDDSFQARNIATLDSESRAELILIPNVVQDMSPDDDDSTATRFLRCIRIHPVWPSCQSGAAHTVSTGQQKEFTIIIVETGACLAERQDEKHACDTKVRTQKALVSKNRRRHKRDHIWNLGIAARGKLIGYRGLWLPFRYIGISVRLE